ncbi:DUF3419 family protein [Nanoarchaeota archaeon]
MLTKEKNGSLNLDLDNDNSQNKLKLIEGESKYCVYSNGKFNRNSQIYSFTTENLSGYLPKLPLEGAKVLTVCGSGDSIINSYMLGADEVVAFDINKLSGYYTDLKLATLNNLDHNRFKQFFMRQSKDGQPNTDALNYQTYESLRNQLNSTSKHLFDKGFKINNYDGQRLRESSLFNNKYDHNELKIFSNPYLQSEENYEKAKSNLKNTTWINSPVQSVADKLEKSFDIILLSNIADYAHLIYSRREDYLNSFAKEIIIPLSNILNSKGEICAAYVYDAEKTDYRSQIDNPKIRRSVFKSSGLNYSEEHFDSVIPGKKDAVVLLQKQ